MPNLEVQRRSGGGRWDSFITVYHGAKPKIRAKDPNYPNRTIIYTVKFEDPPKDEVTIRKSIIENGEKPVIVFDAVLARIGPGKSHEDGSHRFIHGLAAFIAEERKRNK